uniref:Uncharacterized protein n=1 Tax=Hyaloperonospora arabidopsidis (strain Emoy2) TaxID=559515 RepID=M4BVH7_HYAAE
MPILNQYKHTFISLRLSSFPNDSSDASRLDNLAVAAGCLENEATLSIGYGALRRAFRRAMQNVHPSALSQLLRLTRPKHVDRSSP